MSGAMFNLSTSIIGAGIMSIPATLRVLGVAPALLLILEVGLLAEMSVEFLLRSIQAEVSRSYARVMGEAFCRWGSTALQICIMITGMGCLIVYLIIIGKACMYISISLYIYIYRKILLALGVGVGGGRWWQGRGGRGGGAGCGGTAMALGQGGVWGAAGGSGGRPGPAGPMAAGVAGAGGDGGNIGKQWGWGG